MWRFWHNFIRPVCDTVEPTVLVEVGSLGGLDTHNVVAYCRETGAHCHVIDPTPLDSTQIEEIIGGVGTFHQDLSLNVLGDLPGDLFLIDGDHNWYTVFHELRAIEECAQKAGRPFPVVCLHDVRWPYGRRDLYYAPEQIPDEHRQPHARQGMSPDQDALLPKGGYNYRHFNALHEGGPRNGVLTAVEDFVDQSSVDYRVLVMPGFHGFAVLYSPDHVASEVDAELARLFELPPHVAQHLEALEEDRLRLLTEVVDTHAKLGGPPSPAAAGVVRLLRRIKRVRQTFEQAAT